MKPPDVFCHSCGKRIRYLESYIGDNPFRFFCTEHADCAEGQIRWPKIEDVEKFVRFALEGK